MRKLIFAGIVGLLFGVGTAMAQRDYCFQSDEYNFHRLISFTETNNQITGSFAQTASGSQATTDKFDFTGTKNANFFTITFKDKLPYATPAGTSSIVWTLGKKNTLSVPISIKNRATGKWATTNVIFGRCRDI
jgi:hypothetical protein